MKFTVPRRHRKAFDTYSEKKLDQNFSKEESSVENCCFMRDW